MILAIVLQHAYVHSDRCCATVRSFISKRLPATCNWNLISQGKAKQVAVHCTTNDTVRQLRQFLPPVKVRRHYRFQAEAHGVSCLATHRFVRITVNFIYDR